MIYPNAPQTTAAVAAHYDELDLFYRLVWGEHVHHGYWVTGRETAAAAATALIDLLATRLDFRAGQAVCDIGCGYGATARYLAARHGLHVTGLTVSTAQAGQAAQQSAANVSILHADWLANDLPPAIFDRAYAIESSEHMPDKQRFFDEAFRTLKPGSRLAVCAWLAADHPAPWQVRHLLEPICREGRLPCMGDEADYRALAQSSGFQVLGVLDISNQVSRTWWICAGRLLRGLCTDSRFIRHLLDRAKPDRIFAVTLFRLLVAYRTGAMRYALLVYEKPNPSV
jgi:tocopherol O-methyltransferase